MKRWLVLLMVCLMVAVIPYQTPDTKSVDASGEHAELARSIDKILSDERLDGALAGVSIRSAKTGELIYEHLAETRLKPASNMKLLTAAAALETLGPDYTFKTELLTDGKLKGKVLNGNLYLKGKGDPTLLKEDYDELAKELKQKGVSVVTGSLIADDSWYDHERFSEDLTWNDETQYYGASISALTASPNEDYDAGTVIVAAYPSDKEGEPAEITVTPKTDYVQIINRTKTVAKDGEKDISIEREHGGNKIVVEGTIPVDVTRSRSWVAVWEPTGYALDLFQQSLEDEGIRVNNRAKVSIATPVNAEKLVSKDSMPLSELLIPFMKLSNNGHAEVLVKEMGKVVHDEGSWDKGIEVVESFLKNNGIDTKTLRIRDGSGISHVNMVPANELSKLLYVIKEKEWYNIYLNSLPVAGASERFVGGTLRYRMNDTLAAGNVKAKTGSLTGVTSLTGYVTTKDDEELIFSIILNNFIDDDLKEIEDKIAIELAEYEFKGTNK
ncbi:D-alanyl-D-alanine carboxypeptidase/D-alanyl-D-alanine-endopeptidase [Pseudalkalibacillus caeni]|uniref:D-alanyl-D-alanine carboxypeptidase/D-alanyl-D-alanine-endopeptidase n=2 Tax=Exobacillus caeni TaxID=2574798 RepID=A0A5R9F5Q2_9BACL|nr:D-alanyl-D-alanine carboxypeptidase/D-alanyl-D-alanine-endopeptidase [Pseudalkalibacillus caeni]TLS36143.1 D-alanyl-D-alanine carboxypeptidase/D-alanyl-D-alanine-endopeptidase [Pseudalkalibacillus caeni]